ncbi:MAG: LytR/AlgR family response regulator transcription factor, partial [Thermoflexibacteraceae bacterium]
MTALIIEDEYLAAERLQKLIKKLAPDCQVVSTVGSVEKAVEWLENNPQPTLIFSDIQLSDGLSFEIFDTVLVKSPIIFTTSYDEYAIKAFKVKSIDYLLKPIKIQDLEKAIQKYKDLHQEALTQQLQKIETLIDTIHS